MELAIFIVGFIILAILISGLKHDNKVLREEIFHLSKLVKRLNDVPREHKSQEATITSSPLTTTEPIIKQEEKVNITEDVVPDVVAPLVEPIAATPVMETVIAEEAKAPIDVPLEEQSVTEILQEPAEHIVIEPATPKLSWFANFKKNNPDVEKFIGENLINKVGILILVLGISFFVKYAIDREWINEPARVGIGILCGGLLLFVAHKLRKNYQAFSSVLVAGAIAVFYFTIGIAFHDYQLFSQATAFVIMVVITLFSAFVAIAYNRQELIILALLGGFAVPFMVSTGSGNYQVLFTYLIILNSGMVLLSYFKKWWLGNFIAFALTYIIFSVWYQTSSEPSVTQYKYALLFVSVFYIQFSIAFLLHNIARKSKVKYLDMAVFLLNTTIYYGLGITIMRHFLPTYQGLFTLILGLYNIMYAIVLYKKFKFDYTIVYVLIGIALTFATITIPIQFSGNYITIFWIAEAVLLLWLAQKSKMRGFTYAAMVIQVLAVFSMVLDWQLYLLSKVEGGFLWNKLFVTGLIMIISLIVSLFLFKKYTYTMNLWGIVIGQNSYRKYLFSLALIFGYLVPIFDIYYFSNEHFINRASIPVFSVIYHIIYTGVIVYFGLSSRQIVPPKLAYVLVVINLVGFIGLWSRWPLAEKQNGIIDPVSASNLAFWFHYIITAVLLLQVFYTYKQIRVRYPHQKIESHILPWFFVFVLVYVCSVEMNIVFSHSVSDLAAFDANFTFVSKVIFPILWGIISFVFLIYGIRQNRKTTRIVALVLLGITIIKLFVYDIKNVSETGKIIAFILLGLLILTISFVYQKIKRLVIEDKNVDDEQSK